MAGGVDASGGGGQPKAEYVIRQQTVLFEGAREGSLKAKINNLLSKVAVLLNFSNEQVFKRVELTDGVSHLELVGSFKDFQKFAPLSANQAEDSSTSKLNSIALNVLNSIIKETGKDLGAGPSKRKS